MVIWGWFHNLAGNTIHVSALMHSCTCAKYMYGFQVTKILSPNHAMIQGPNYILIKPQLSPKQDCKNPRQINFWIFGLESKQLLPHLLTFFALMGHGLSICRTCNLALCWSQFRTDPAPNLHEPNEPRNTWLRHCFPPTLQQNIGTCTHVSRLICDLCCPKNEWRMPETNRNVRSSSGVFQHISF